MPCKSGYSRSSAYEAWNSCFCPGVKHWSNWSFIVDGQYGLVNELRGIVEIHPSFGQKEEGTRHTIRHYGSVWTFCCDLHITRTQKGLTTGTIRPVTSFFFVLSALRVSRVLTLYQSPAISMSDSDVYLSSFSVTNDSAEADRPLSKTRMTSSFSDRSTAVGPLPTVFKPHLRRFTPAALGPAIFLVMCSSIISRIYNFWNFWTRCSC